MHWARLSLIWALSRTLDLTCLRRYLPRGPTGTLWSSLPTGGTLSCPGSRARGRGTWDVDMLSAGRCFAGLAAVDLGLRLCGLNWLTGMNVRLPEIPLWAEENGIGKILRFRLSDAELTREQLAARLRFETSQSHNLVAVNTPGGVLHSPQGRKWSCRASRRSPL